MAKRWGPEKIRDSNKSQNRQSASELVVDCRIPLAPSGMSHRPYDLRHPIPQGDPYLFVWYVGDQLSLRLTS